MAGPTNLKLLTDFFNKIGQKRTKGRNGSRGFLRRACYGHSFMPAIVALRCQSNKAVRSSWASGDGIAGTD